MDCIRDPCCTRVKASVEDATYKPTKKLGSLCCCWEFVLVDGETHIGVPATAFYELWRPVVNYGVAMFAWLADTLPFSVKSL